MLITVVGFGYSGSGAVLDYLKEFSENRVLTDVEMNIIYLPDGVKDLEYHLCENHYRFMSSDVAIQRFLERMKIVSERLQRKYRDEFNRISYEYVSSLVQVKWTGYSFAHRGEYNSRQRYWIFKFPAQVRYMLGRIGIKISPARNPQRQMYLSINPDNFLTITQKYLQKIISLFSGGEENNKNIVIDQLFAADNIDTCVKYIPDCKVISVTRDPRDIYLLIKEGIKPRISFIPTDTVESFTEYYLRFMNPRTNKSSYGLNIRYEDLIYNYEETTKSICKYLEIEWQNSRKYFNPNVSIRNTQLYKKYPQHISDIEYIKSHCKDYLYPFDESINIDTSQNIF